MSGIEEEIHIINIPKSQRRRLYKVSVPVRRGKTHIYEPAVVSLGPYHHRRDQQLELMEPFKDELRDIVCGGADRKRNLLSKIYERIDEIRQFYGGANGYTDEKLAEMMLRDACFLICYMRGFTMGGDPTHDRMCERMGMSAMMFVARDTRMLENQIPLRLISLIHPQQYKSLLCEYLSYQVYDGSRMTKLPWREGEEPLHLLEALHRTFLRLDQTQQDSSFFRRLIEKYNQPRAAPKKQTSVWERFNSPFRSVTDLKAKGIHLRGSSHCLTDIHFLSFGLFAQLHLPVFFLADDSMVTYFNLIAFEMSPDIDTDFGVITYCNFMKTLINDVKDVKVLREKGILKSMLASDEEVVEIFKSIDTYGFSNTVLFYEEKTKIDNYCNSKARTWMADLINTNFRSPWAVIALAAAIFLLCLAFLQTYYTIHPRKNNAT